MIQFNGAVLVLIEIGFEACINIFHGHSRLVEKFIRVFFDFEIENARFNEIIFVI